MKTICCKWLVAVVIASLAVNGRAITFTLDHLIANGGQHAVTIGDVTFSDWGFTGPGPGCGISVTATQVDPMCYELTFRRAPGDRDRLPLSGLSGQFHFSAATTSGDPALAALNDCFDVTISGANGISINETFYNSSHQPLTDLTASKVWVTKSVNLSTAPQGPVTAIICGGECHRDVPDGAGTLCLLGIALTGLAGMRRLLGC